MSPRAASWNARILLRAIAAMRHPARPERGPREDERKREANDMAGLKKLVAVTLAVTVVAALAVYVLRPNAGPNGGTVATNEPGLSGPSASKPVAPFADDVSHRRGPTPQAPSDHGSGGNGGGGDEPGPSARDHGKDAQNSNGPKHPVCVPANDHVPDHARDEGANQYRGSCATFPANHILA